MFHFLKGENTVPVLRSARADGEAVAAGTQGHSGDVVGGGFPGKEATHLPGRTPLPSRVLWGEISDWSEMYATNKPLPGAAEALRVLLGGPDHAAQRSGLLALGKHRGSWPVGMAGPAPQEHACVLSIRPVCLYAVSVRQGTTSAAGRDRPSGQGRVIKCVTTFHPLAAIEAGVIPVYRQSSGSVCAFPKGETTHKALLRL